MNELEMLMERKKTAQRELRDVTRAIADIKAKNSKTKFTCGRAEIWKRKYPHHSRPDEWFLTIDRENYSARSDNWPQRNVRKNFSAAQSFLKDDVVDYLADLIKDLSRLYAEVTAEERS